VAVAGVHAMARRSPRAVVVIVDQEPSDASAQPPAVVRSYLSVLGVPLTVWSTHPDTNLTSWGPAVDISLSRKLERASQSLEERLSRQLIAWVEGSYLPHEIVTKPELQGWSLVR